MPVKPYNPLDKNSIGDNIVKELMTQSCLPLPRVGGSTDKGDVFEGAGLYAIYYYGQFPAYAQIASDNRSGQCRTPIYVGKADPRGGRKGAMEMNASIGTSLYSRLKEHAESIIQAENLDGTDFLCRHLVVDEVWIGLGERTAIRTYLPLWNTKIDGFGNHDPGTRRASQFRSDWDTVHPGRNWAVKLGQNPRTSQELLAFIQAVLPLDQLEELAGQAIAAEEA